LEKTGLTKDSTDDALQRVRGDIHRAARSCPAEKKNNCEKEAKEMLENVGMKERSLVSDRRFAAEDEAIKAMADSGFDEKEAKEAGRKVCDKYRNCIFDEKRMYGAAKKYQEGEQNPIKRKPSVDIDVDADTNGKKFECNDKLVDSIKRVASRVDGCMKLKTLKSPKVVKDRCVATIRASLCDTKDKSPSKVADELAKPLARRLNSIARRLEGVKTYAGQTRGVGEYDESETGTSGDENKSDSLPLIAAAAGGGTCCLGMIAVALVLSGKKGKARGKKLQEQGSQNQDSAVVMMIDNPQRRSK